LIAGRSGVFARDDRQMFEAFATKEFKWLKGCGKLGIAVSLSRGVAVPGCGDCYVKMRCNLVLDL
jgi:hypothetical protein